MTLAVEIVGVGISPLAANTIPGGVPTTIVAAGSIQTDATDFAAGTVRVTGADGTKGVQIPNMAPGDSCVIVNDSASTLKVWPPAGSAIGVPGTSFGAAVANASFAHTTFAVIRYTCFSSTLIMINKSA